MTNRITRTKHSKYKYYAVRCPLKYECMSDGGGYVMEHRLLMAIWRGSPLCKNERVIHLDKNSLNNEISNLRIMRVKCKKK